MDIWQSIANLLLVTLGGLLIAFNPSLIVINFFVVLKSKKPIRDAIVLIAGVVLPLLIIALITIFWLKPDSSFHFGGLADKIEVPPLIDLLFGLSLIVYASLRQLRKPAKKTGSGLQKKSLQIITSPKSIFTFGFVRSCLSVTNLLAVVVIAKIIVVNQTRPLVAFLGVSWALIIGIAPLVAAPYMHEYRPRYLLRVQSTIDQLLSRDNSAVVTVALAVIGLFFMLNGLLKLTG